MGVPDGQIAPTSSGQTTACCAPQSALYFRPDGLVMTCCSGWHVLGRVNGPDRQSLREIWDGRPRAELSDALRRGSFDLGCFSCKVDADSGDVAATLARSFDRYGAEPRRYPAIMDFALSDRCNLQCVQCSGTFSSAIRRHREGRSPLEAAYDDRFFEELDEFLPHLERAQFKGGEPFLMRETRRIWDRLLDMKLRPESVVTTNGTIWNRHVERYTEELGFDVTVSVDAVDANVLEAIRVGADSAQLWRNVERFRAITASTGHTLTLSFCLMSINFEQLAPFLRTCDRLLARPHIEWVGGPGNFCLLTMPSWDLAAALDRLERQGAEFADMDPATRSVWDDALDRIRAAVGAEGQEVSVELTGSTSPTASFEERLQSAMAELCVTDPGDLIRLDFVNEILTSVSVPPWSEWLRPASWAGVGLREMLTTIATAADGTMHSDVEPIEGGSHRLLLRFDLGARMRSLRGMSIPADDSGSICVLLAEED